MRVLLLSAYEAASHRHWRNMLEQGLEDCRFTSLVLPPRHFNWRLRGNALYWAREMRATLCEQYDLLLATSMVDLATLRGLVPEITALPTLLYFHENQFDYPASSQQQGRLEAQMVSLYSALAADILVFNSSFNRQGFLDGVEHLLRKLPDFVPAHIATDLQEKSRVLPVPVAVTERGAVASPGEPIQLLWNHRWEYDKGPADLLALVQAALASGLDFTLHVVGQQFRQQPCEFEAIESLLSDAGRLGSWGYLQERGAYLDLLARCDVVLSTALHDFQGLSVIEACLAGCVPLLPDRLVYGEYFEPDHRFADIESAIRRLQALAALKAAGTPLPLADVSQFVPDRLLPEYEALLRSQLRPNSVS